MTHEELIEYNKNRKICQLCLVVKDIEYTLKEMVEKLKIGPWMVITVSDETTDGASLNGVELKEPFKFLCALAMCGNLQIEVIQPCYGVALYQDFLDKHGDGLHHFKEEITDSEIENKLAEYALVGITPTFRGFIKHDKFVNLSTVDIFGCTYEIGNNADMTLPEDMYYMYP